jgi:hypothetical protein
MKNYLLFLPLFLSCAISYGQDWAKEGPSSDGAEGKGIVADNNGNIYTVGYFTGSITFGSTTLNASASTDVDLFIAKHTSSGALKWVKKYGSTLEDKATSITISSDGRLYLTGFFNGSISLGSTTLNSAGGSDVFWARIDTAGTIIWAFNGGGTGDDYGNDIEADFAGNLYLTGSFQNSASFTSTTLNSSGGDDIFLSRINSSGTCMWSVKAGGSSNDYSNALSTDLAGDCYITGGFRSTCDFSGTSLSSMGDVDAFAAKYNTAGNLTWATRMGAGFFDEGRGIDVDKQGNSYLIGNSYDAGIYNPSFYYSVNAYYFTAQLNTSGSLTTSINGLWNGPYGSMTCNSCYVNPTGNDIIVGKDGLVYITGLSRIGVIVYPNPAEARDWFFLQRSFAASSWMAPSSGGTAIGNAFTIDQNGKIFTTGYFEYTATLNSVSFSGNSQPSAFIMGNDITPLPLPVNIMKGQLFEEKNSNCLRDPSERALRYIPVKINSGGYSHTDSAGNYQAGVAAGTYTITPVIPDYLKDILTRACPLTDTTVTFSSSGETKSGLNYGYQMANCSALIIDVISGNRRRCFRGTTSVRYCNEGKLAASNVEINVIYPNYTIPLKSMPVWNSKNDSMLTYNIGTLAPGQCGTIAITDSVSCITGITGFGQCTKVRISPKNVCVTESTSWDKSSIVVSGNCIDGQAKFTILNHGLSMAGFSQYRVYFNNVLGYTSNFRLNADGTLEVNIDAQGQTIRLEADQRPFHPGNSKPRETIEGCGSATLATADRGYYLQVPVDIANVEEDAVCTKIVDSFDPNDKSVVPAGIAAENYIKDSDYLDYVIRFQNTGTDTAYTVRLIDTLSNYLDVEKLQIKEASHPYTMELSGTNVAVLAFNFDKINLPDSATDNAGSNGYIRFRIGQKAGNTKGTQIKNRAGIYFDFNEPVYTNQTLNTVHDTIIEDPTYASRVSAPSTPAGLFKNSISDFKVQVFPNPVENYSALNIQLPSALQGNLKFIVSDPEGREVASYSINGAIPDHQLKLANINPGLYLYKIEGEEGLRSYGKLVILE